MHLSRDGFISAPVVVVFTKYDKLVRTKMFELREDKACLDSDGLNKLTKEEAQKALDTTVQSLHRAIRRMDSKMDLPPWAKVSSKFSYSFFSLALISL
jgi:hypothetical protein